MPDFLYRAKTANGKNTQGTISAGSHREALAILTQQALFPLEVRDQSVSRFKIPFSLEFKRRIKAEVIADAITQLADLLANGVPMLESLRILADQTVDKRLSAVMGEIHDAVENGASLDDAIAEHSDVFSPLTVNMVRAGMEGAFLEEALERIAAFMRKQNELRGKVTSAMTYPAILMIVGCLVAIFLIVVIVPMFETFFNRLERSGVGLPLVTIILLAISEVLTRFGLIILVGIAASVLAIRQWLSSEAGSYVLDAVKLRLPIAGPIFHESAISRFCRVLGTLLRNGVPILRSLEISSASAGNKLLEKVIQDSAENISAGNLLSQPLADSELVPDQVMAMIKVAEESNTLDEVLVKISDRMDKKIERRLDMMVRLIEPIMLLTIGAVVMFVIAGVLLPVVDLNSAIE